MAKDSFNKIVTLFFLGEPLLNCKACMLMHISLSSSFCFAMACNVSRPDTLLCSLQIDPAKRLLPRFSASHRHWMIPASLPQPF